MVNFQWIVKSFEGIKVFGEFKAGDVEGLSRDAYHCGKWGVFNPDGKTWTCCIIFDTTVIFSCCIPVLYLVRKLLALLRPCFLCLL